jgi:hypothetical protein
MSESSGPRVQGEQRDGTTQPAPGSGAMTRTARSLRQMRGVPDVGVAARSAQAFSAGFGVAASGRQTSPAPPSPGAVAALPWGVWPRAEADTDDVAILGSALAAYREQLRRKREPTRQSPDRGLPILARRAGSTRHGRSRGPGGLARSLTPVDHPVQPIEPDLRRKGA